MLTSREQERELVAGQTDPVSKAALKATFHLRRYMPLYAFGTVWVLMIALLPTIDHHGSSASKYAGDAGQSGVVASGPAAQTNAGGAAATQSSTGGSASAAAGVAAGSATAARSTSGAAAAAGPGQAPVVAPTVGSGVTIGGVPCQPGVRQIPFSSYADLCEAKYAGGNGGTTYRGVTNDTITIAVRIPSDANGPNAQAVDKVNQEAGNPTTAQQVAIRDALIPYFNKMFELYGRHVKLVDFNGQGNGTMEAESQGQDAACADADAIATQVKAFGVIRYPATYESQPFAECAAQYHLWLPLGAAYFPESYYQRWDPYVWGDTMECERISHDVAEYIGKRLANKPAKWAGDVTYQQENRKFATYVPNNEGYQHCVNISETDLKQKYGVPITSRYNYTLDVSQFPSEAAKGIVQFHADGATTIIMACDPISTIFLMQQADSQQYHPEWLSIGVAGQDTDAYARLWQSGSPDQTNGHLFGMSQLGSDFVTNAKDGEANKAYEAASNGQQMQQGGFGVYVGLLSMFNQLMAAGPALTPQAIATGSRALPTAGGATGAFGTWSFAHEHTAIIDSREIYWDSKAIGYDGKAGDYLQTYNGKRFQSGQWASEDPPIKPE